jgi:porin
MTLSALIAAVAAQSAAPPPDTSRPVPVPPVAEDRSMRQAGPDEAAQALERSLEEGPPKPLPEQLGLRLFPTEQPRMMPYLASANLYGSECLQSGALVEKDPVSDAAQAVKTALAAYGINYGLWQSYDFVGVTGAQSGTRSTFNYYSMDFYGTLNVFSTDEMGGTAGWLTFAASAGSGLGYDAEFQGPRQSIGAQGYPLGVDYQQDIFVAQLAWQQSFLDGELVVTAGFLNQEYYLDLNTYANNQYNQLLNYEFVTPSLLPWSFQSMGVVVQWQPTEWFYAMWGSAANNTPQSKPAFENLSSDNWTNTFEVGLIAEDFLGLGPGIYRAVPFVATVNGSTGAGVVFNVEQRLGKEGALAVFGRGGFGNPNVTQLGGTEASFAGGVVLLGPTDAAFFRGQQAYLAAGFYWLDSALQGTPNSQEYGFELTYVLQVTPTVTVQPDLQVILDPTFNAEHDTAVALTLQLNVVW